MKQISILLILCTLVSSCGYRFGRGEVVNQYCTVCIPYVEGDDRGVLTTSLIRAITTRGALAYRSCGADLKLNVCLFSPVDTNIGFAYAPPDERGVSNIVVSNEARLQLTARVTVVDRCTGQCVLGPMEITRFIDYDFEPDLGNVDVHAFSLGQLEMHNLAQDAAFYPLYTLLAEKIVDYVNNSW